MPTDMRRLCRTPTKPLRPHGPVYRTLTSAIDGRVGCGFCQALRELLGFEWSTDRQRFEAVAASGGCMFAIPGIAFVRIEVDDEYGLFAPADPVTGLALPGQRSLWFRNADLGIEGTNEAAGRGTAPWSVR
jgi:hypothetical protein